MGSKGGAPPPSASPASPPVVCCMCGDHGFSPELFRCKICLFRSQHKYCSDLYPRAEAYRACNWCLREEAGSRLLLAGESSIADRTSWASPSPPDHGGGNRGSASGLKLCRGAFSPQLNRPVKKQRLGDRRQTDGRVVGEEFSPRSGRGRLAFRGKVRRYKLLEEVSS